MTSKLAATLALATSITAAHANNSGLYYVPNDTEESSPIKWSVGATLTYDDNPVPGGINDGDDAFSINPYVGVSFVSDNTADDYRNLR